MKKKGAKRYIFPVALICLWIGLLSVWTHGFETFTIYSYTLASAGPLPREFPPITDRKNYTTRMRQSQGIKCYTLNAAHMYEF
ncbi:MAG: hypothetical protein IEMM0008_1155 [bacterium]|nr:MAG: hypothetical protein IEMM0008_1155 [bacterium]